jgi:hypothetical protein
MPVAPSTVLPAINARDGTGLAWDQISLDGEIFPPGGAKLVPNAHGMVEVDPKIGRDLGSHRTKGKDGHRVVDKGMKPAEVKITLTAFDDEGFEALGKLCALFQPRKRLKDRKPITIDYPSTNALGISAVVVGELSGPKPTGVQGMAAMTLQCLEFTPPAKRRNNVTRTVTAPPQLPNAVLDAYGGGASNRINQPATAFNYAPNTEP